MEPIRLRASEESKNQRLDAFLASSLDGLTRSQATRLIESGEVAVRDRTEGDRGVMTLEAFLRELREVVETRAH